jgi:hypothetical protein
MLYLEFNLGKLFSCSFSDFNMKNYTFITHFPPETWANNSKDESGIRCAKTKEKMADCRLYMGRLQKDARYFG